MLFQEIHSFSGISNITPEGFTAATVHGLGFNFIQAKYNRLWVIRHYKISHFGNM